MKSKMVLIVEDDHDICEALKELIEIEGHHVQTAENGQIALDKLKILKRQNELPDLIFLDLMMPVMNGSNFIEQAYKEPDFKKIPLFVLSAGGDRSKIPLDVRILEKPINLEKMYSVLNEILSAPV